MGPVTFVRRASIPVLALLALATVLDGVAFAQRVEACAMVRRPAAERKGCCALAGVERITREGGDCCKTLTLAATEDALSASVAVEVPPAMVVAVLLPVVDVAQPRELGIATARARAPPPPLWRPTDTVRLLL
jgi:hypothetical protein